MTFFSEFDGVVEQIKDDLFQATLIGGCGSEIITELQLQVQPLLFSQRSRYPSMF